MDIQISEGRVFKTESKALLGVVIPGIHKDEKEDHLAESIG